MKKGKRIRFPFGHYSTGRRNYTIIPSESPLTLEEFTEVYTRYFKEIKENSPFVFDSLPAFLEYMGSLKGRGVLGSVHNSCRDGYHSLSVYYWAPKLGDHVVALYGWRRKDFKPLFNGSRDEFLSIISQI